MRKERQKFLTTLGFALIMFAGSALFFYLGGHKNISPAFRAYRDGKIEWGR